MPDQPRSAAAAPAAAADTLTLNGVACAVRPGETLLQVARRAGVVIPTLCHDDRLAPTGACRMCLVESSDSRRLVPACRHPASAGLQVQSESARVQRHRRALLALYAADHPEAAVPGSELERWLRRYGVAEGVPALPQRRQGRPDDDNAFITFQPERCILCARCTRYCDEVEAVAAIALGHRGPETTIVTADQRGLLDTSCELCGGCVDTCPTGALVERGALARQHELAQLAQVRTTCGYCGVGCQLDLSVDRAAGAIVRVQSPPPGTTTNDGNLCVKGRFATGFVGHPERLTAPLVRDADGALRPTDWETALDRTFALLDGVRRRHGSDALGFISSSRATNAENYLVQKLARAGFGSNNIHQCAAT
jgi:predicted molibdopterin-dependent oxidoreductase YjgC